MLPVMTPSSGGITVASLANRRQPCQTFQTRMTVARLTTNRTMAHTSSKHCTCQLELQESSVSYLQQECLGDIGRTLFTPKAENREVPESWIMVMDSVYFPVQRSPVVTVRICELLHLMHPQTLHPRDSSCYLKPQPSVGRTTLVITDIRQLSGGSAAVQRRPAVP